jgi:hypothetical protein
MFTTLNYVSLHLREAHLGSALSNIIASWKGQFEAAAGRLGQRF